MSSKGSSSPGRATTASADESSRDMEGQGKFSNNPADLTEQLGSTEGQRSAPENAQTRSSQPADVATSEVNTSLEATSGDGSDRADRHKRSATQMIEQSGASDATPQQQQRKSKGSGVQSGDRSSAVPSFAPMPSSGPYGNQASPTMNFEQIYTASEEPSGTQDEEEMHFDHDQDDRHSEAPEIFSDPNDEAEEQTTAESAEPMPWQSATPQRNLPGAPALTGPRIERQSSGLRGSSALRESIAEPNGANAREVARAHAIRQHSVPSPASASMVAPARRSKDPEKAHGPPASSLQSGGARRSSDLLAAPRNSAERQKSGGTLANFSGSASD